MTNSMKASFLLIFAFLCLTVKSQTVVPQKGSGSKFSLSCANIYFEVDSAHGARITSFKLDGKEIMYVDFKTSDMAGSTFWPSPQSVWGWPPAVNLDSKPYRTAIRENKIVFTGNTDTKSMLRFYKTVAANPTDTSIVIDYCIKNEKTTAQKWAPWEITRVLNSGLTVFSKGSGGVTGNMNGRTEDISDYVWYDQDFTKGEAGDKFFCDGKGWLAHVVGSDILFIKKFDDVASGKAAPSEAEVEVYTNPNQSYTELENQGTYTSIASKDSVSWRVKWFARELPASIDVSVGSTSLTNYIEAVLKREAPLSGISVANKVNARIYPNPAEDLLTIETGFAVGANATIRIVDLQGRIVLSNSLMQSKIQISIANLQQGFYIYNIRQGNETVSKGQLMIRH
jgi:hypothetical protein